jgi:hypothetical protein
MCYNCQTVKKDSCVYCQKLVNPKNLIMVIKPNLDDILVTTVFMHSTVHMFAWIVREIPIRIVNSTKIWILGALMRSYILNLYISMETDFLLWIAVHISVNYYEIKWETLTKSRHRGRNMCNVFVTTQIGLPLLQDATSHWSTGETGAVSHVYDIIGIM